MGLKGLSLGRKIFRGGPKFEAYFSLVLRTSLISLRIFGRKEIHEVFAIHSLMVLKQKRATATLYLIRMLF